ncbi:MAG: AMP-binding protein [Treponema sp.]|nr:AMP-binding protein [Treponema sp.]
MPRFTFDKSYPKNLALMFKARAEELKDDVFQYSKDKEGNFKSYTYGQVYDEVIALAVALKDLGINRGANVGLISDNRREWALIDFALLSLGATDVPRGCDSMGVEIRFILNYADCEFSFFETARQLEKVLEKPEECPNLKYAILINTPTEEEAAIYDNGKFRVITFESLLARGIDLYAANKTALQKEIEDGMEKTDANDNATIIFTSGTTGTPKGVMLTHRNYMAQVEVIHNFFPCKRGETWLTVLPVWHSFERAFQYFIPALKCNVAYSKPIPQIMIADMQKMKPHWMCAVPRIWSGIAKNVDRTINKHKGWNLFCYKIFMGPAKAYIAQKDKVYGWVCQIEKRNRFLDFVTGIIPFILLWPIHKLGEICLFKTIQKGLGGNIKIAVSGGGALQREVNDFFRAVGFNLLEGYGLTETAPVVSVRDYKAPRPGCVGALLPSVEVKIVKEENGVIADSTPLPFGQKGLVLVKSEQNMKGYYKRQDLTDAIIDNEGWLNTGDIGLLTFDNELKITGRAKDTIVLLGGENIEPLVIEQAITASDYIESAIVLGQDQNSLGCLIVPQKDMTEAYAKENNIQAESYEELLKKEEIISYFSKTVHSLVSVNTGFRSCERINKIALLPASFRPGEELSAKGEMIRPKIAKKYEQIIATLF